MKTKLIIAKNKINNSSLAKRYINGAYWSLLATATYSFLNLIMYILVARILGKENYGNLVVIQSTLMMFGTFAGFGLGGAITKYTSELKKTDKLKLGKILFLSESLIVIFSLIALIILISLNEQISEKIIKQENMRYLLLFAAGSAFFTAIDSYQKSILIGFEAMRELAITSVLGLIFGFPIMLILTSKYGITGSAIALNLVSFSQLFFSKYQTMTVLKKYEIQYQTKNFLTESSMLWNFALPALFSSALVGPSHWLTQTFLTTIPNGYIQLAILGVVMQWFYIFQFIPGSISKVVLPLLSDDINKKNTKTTQTILTYTSLGNLIATIPLVIIASIFSSQIMSLYGSDFAGDGNALIIISITAMIVVIQIPVGSYLAAHSHMWIGVMMNIGWATSYIILSYILHNRGAIGIIIALCISYLIHTIWLIIFVRKNFRRDIKNA